MQDPYVFPPPPGKVQTVAPGVRRILAPNPSAMTGPGTNTYLVGQEELAVIDPGPRDPHHLAAILDALAPDQRISHILVTHAHLDHSPLARDLSRATGAPVLAHGDATAGRSEVMRHLASRATLGGGEGVDSGFAPDVTLADGETLSGRGWSLRAIWTPGHFGNHLCFATDDLVFTGDLVMGWSTSLVSPPDGDLTDFMASCRKLQQLPARLYLPGHGEVVAAPQARLDWLIRHRLEREASLLAALATGPGSAAELAARVYTEIAPSLLPAATRNVLAHLIDLQGKKLVRSRGVLDFHVIFERS